MNFPLSRFARDEAERAGRTRALAALTRSLLISSAGNFIFRAESLPKFYSSNIPILKRTAIMRELPRDLVLITHDERPNSFKVWP